MKTIIKHIDNQLQYFEKGDIQPSFIGINKIRFFKETRIIYKKSQEILRVQPKLGSILNLKYNITFYQKNNSTILKYTGGFIKPSYECTYKFNIYRIIPHKGRKTSIFKNNKQIAFYERGVLSSMGIEQINLYANDNINRMLIYSFILSIEYTAQNENVGVSINFGNIGKELQEFDKDWKPLSIEKFQ